MNVQETPQLFTLIVVLSVVASFGTFMVAAYRFIRGRRAGAVQMLTRWGWCAAAYLAVSITVSLLKPSRLIERGQNWCFDDWCVAVERVVRHPPLRDDAPVTYTTELRLFNAGHSPQSVRGFWASLRDDRDDLYPPLPGAWAGVVATPIQPQAFARTSMDFVVPADVHPVGFVSNHGGGRSTCALLQGLLEIGQGGCLFHKRNMIRIDD